MALKPTLKVISTIDALVGGTVSASFSGSLPYSNKLCIYDASTLTLVWSDTVTSHLLNNCHTIPANILTNGNKYAATIQFFDVDNNGSDISDKSYFYTAKTPTFYLTQDGTTKLNDNDVVKNSNLHLEIYYSQEDNDSLTCFRFTLYDSEKNQLSRTDLIYDTSSLSYDFKGVTNRTTYYVRAEAQTSRGVDCDTGLIAVFTNFANPSNYARVYASSDKYSVINGYTNVNVIEPDESDYEYDVGYIKLVDKSIKYSNLEISGDFTISLKMKNVIPTKELFRATSPTQGDIYLTTINYEEKVVFKFVADCMGLTNYVLYSEPFYVGEEDIVFAHIRRISNVYQLYVTVNDIDETEQAFFFYQHEPTGELSLHDVWIDTSDTTQVKVEKADRVVYYQDAEPTTGSSAIVIDTYEKTSPTTVTATLKDKQIWIG